MIYGKTLLCIVDYHSKFLIVKKSLSADELVQMTKLIFAEYGFPKINTVQQANKAPVTENEKGPH